MHIKSNNDKAVVINVLVLVLISFSPLLHQNIKAIILVIITIFNLRNLKLSTDLRTLLLLSILIIFILNAFIDTYNTVSLKDYSPLNFYYPVTFIFGYIFSQKYSITEYLNAFHKVIFPFAVLSLIGVSIYYFAPDLVYRLPSYTNAHTTHKTALIFNFLIDVDGNVIRRNTGIAWEPGAFQFLLNLGLFSYFQINKKKTSFLVILIYIIAILFTRSTAGIFILLFQFIGIAKSNKYYKYILIGLVIAFSSNVYNEINYQLKYKLYGSNSFEYRYNPMKEAYEEGSKSILGLGNTKYNNMLDSDKNIGSYDSYSQIVVRYGFILLFLIIIGLLRIAKYDFLLFLIYFITFFSQALWFFPFITPFYFLKYKKYKLQLQ